MTQHRTTFFLMLNHAANAVTGILFWLLFVRLVGLDPAAVGVGYAVVALGTATGLVAKGGMDTALMRHVPRADGREGRRLLALTVAVGTVVSIAGIAALAAVARAVPRLHGFSVVGWLLAAAIAGMLLLAWLQDAYFLAKGRPQATFARNAAFSAGKLLLPLPVLFLALPAAIPLTWALALLVSGVVGTVLVRRDGPQPGVQVPRRRFFRSASRHVAGNAAEFLPGLLLVPLVLAINGPAAAGFFGMAWTAASLLYLAAAAIGRSALSEMVRRGGSVPAHAVRRAARQGALLLVPGALGGMLLARQVLLVFGSDYAAAATPTLVILCAATFAIAPAYLYLAVLRAQERSVALIVFPLAMVALVFILAPLLAAPFGLAGVASAWLIANTPFGAFAVWRLLHIAKEVPHGTTNVHRRPHLE